MTDTDWHDAQVIEATMPNGERILMGVGGGLFKSAAGMNYWADELSDVRVIVDRDGNVAPPPVTDEMVERAAEQLGMATPYGRGVVRAMLFVALGGVLDE